jgi:long-chain acyl-CoA synthetase
MMVSFTEDDLPLQRVYRWERERGERIFLTQPFEGRKLREWSWAQDWEPGSPVAILSRNSAWWIMADLAIWMAGHVSVPVYPSLRAQTVRNILEHSESKACFLGPTDEKEMANSGCHRAYAGFASLPLPPLLTPLGKA